MKHCSGQPNWLEVLSATVMVVSLIAVAVAVFVSV